MLQITSKPFSGATIQDESRNLFSVSCQHELHASDVNSRGAVEDNLSYQSFSMPDKTIVEKPKVNLLQLLESSEKSKKVFKPIGNQIVVPIQVPIQTKRNKLLNDCTGKPTKPTEEVSLCHRTNLVENKNKCTGTVNNQVAHFSFPKSNVKREKDSDSLAFPVYRMPSSNLKIKDSVKIETSLVFFDDLKPSSAFELSDNSLTSLSWLSSKDSGLLRLIRKCNPDNPVTMWSDFEDDNDDDIENKGNVASIFTALSQIYHESSNHSRTRVTKGSTSRKPPYSFSCLIFMAVEDSEQKKLKVKDIYEWINKEYPHFSSLSPSWKNSIRHNLSLSRCFMKAVPEKGDSPKNSYWCINPPFRCNLIESLKRSYFLQSHDGNSKDPEILKKLINLPLKNSNRLQAVWKSTSNPSPDSDITDAALNLIGLSAKGSNLQSNQVNSINNTLDEIFRDVYFRIGYGEKFGDEKSLDEELIVIHDVSQDHNYCAPPCDAKKRSESSDSEKSAPDAAYEFESREFSEEEELHMDAVQDIMEEVMVGSDDEKPSLFDSGFGSMKDFDVKRNQKNPEESPAPNATLSRHRASCSRSDKTTKKSSVKSRRKPATLKCADKVRSKKKDQAVVLKCNVKTTKKKRNNSTSDSGKDSPKLARRSSRTQRSREHFSQKRPHEEPGKIRVSKRKRRLSVKLQRIEEDEEVKLAAGSLLRLAGLIKPAS